MSSLILYFRFQHFIFDFGHLNFEYCLGAVSEYEYVFLISFFFSGKKIKKLSPYGYTDPNFKLTKYEHLELIFRENKFTCTKLILNEADYGMKIGIELYKEKKSNVIKSGRHYSGLCTLHQYFTTGGKPSTCFRRGDSQSRISEQEILRKTEF